MVRSRDEARAAALRAEVVALRATVVELRAELARVRAEAVSAAASAVPESAVAAPADAGRLTLQMPLVKLALGDPDDVAAGPDAAAALAAADRSADTVITEIVLEPSPAPADRLAWSVLANLPERRLLDPRADRDQEPHDHAREAATLAEATPTPGREERRTA
jgi:hypothetical protein